MTYTATVSPTPDGGTIEFTDNSTPITGSTRFCWRIPTSWMHDR